MIQKKWIASLIIGLAVFFIIIASCRIDFPQKSDAVKGQLWTEKKVKKEAVQTSETSAALHQFMYLFRDLSKQSEQAVVNVYTTTTVRQRQPMFPFDMFDDFFGDDFFGAPPRDREFRQRPRAPEREFKRQSLGSGFIINEDGYILTNHHVVENADEIKVKLLNGGNGEKRKEYVAKVIGSDNKTDIALIKIDVKEKLPFLHLGNSSKLEKGEWVMAMGNPLGLENTVTAGIVSFNGRIPSDLGIQAPYSTFIQTDAAINPGNSGGPLLNTEGEVVGINAAIVRGAQSIGFAIPIDIAKELLPQLQKGKVDRGWLGISINDLDDEMKKKFDIPTDLQGVLVAQVFEGDPADKAGVKAYDIIVEINDQKTPTARELQRIIGKLGSDKKIKLKIYRDRKFITLTATTAIQDEKQMAQKDVTEKSEKAGISVAEITKKLAAELDLPFQSGVAITAVEQESPADYAGLKSGDIILEIDKKPIKTINDYNALALKFKKGESYFFRIQRGFHTQMFLTVTLAKE